MCVATSAATTARPSRRMLNVNASNSPRPTSGARRSPSHRLLALSRSIAHRLSPMKARNGISDCTELVWPRNGNEQPIAAVSASAGPKPIRRSVIRLKATRNTAKQMTPSHLRCS
jgi:hypothetical protein